ncbi:TetR/AcrR family transcriptional regulator [Paraburkholderia sp. SIMBA_054]|uniref:TetR/AcrR family transcriptional regulator n=1 Tax=Paraburkholderia sp. SIMBA_054 TaxID=3085795 RepID=UPI00397B77D0
MATEQDFDEDLVLEKVMLLLWSRGYDSTSRADIQDATGMTWSRLNRLFGGKEEMFRTVLDRYIQKNLAFHADALAQPTPRLIVRAIMLGLVDLNADSNAPSGCLMALSALACVGSTGPLKANLLEIRNGLERSLRQRLESVTDAGPLPEGMTAHDAAAFLWTMIQGIAVEAKGGATPRRLRDIIDAVLATWPDNFRDAKQHAEGAGY